MRRELRLFGLDLGQVLWRTRGGADKYGEDERDERARAAVKLGIVSSWGLPDLPATGRRRLDSDAGPAMASERTRSTPHNV